MDMQVQFQQCKHKHSMVLNRGAYAQHKRLCFGEDGLNRGIRINTRIKRTCKLTLNCGELFFLLCRCQVPVCYKISLGPRSYIRLAAVISYYFTQIVNVMGIETEDLSLYDLNMTARKSQLTTYYMSFVLALIFYNASLQINISYLNVKTGPSSALIQPTTLFPVKLTGN